MRIAILGTRGIPANYGGFETFAEHLSTRLVARGHAVTVYCRAHYTSPRYSQTIRSVGFVQSMSRKGNCIDNAAMESFFGHLKDELDFKNCKTFQELTIKVNEYMRYYNHDRCQWGLKKMTPVEYRNHLLTADAA